MKFLTAYKKANKYLIKMGFDNGEEKWGVTDVKVYNYAKHNFEQGDEAKFEYTTKEGQYFITKIIKEGKPVEPETKKSYNNPIETGEQIKRLSILKASCNAIQTLVGHFDNVDTLGQMITELYDRLYRKVSG